MSTSAILLCLKIYNFLAIIFLASDKKKDKILNKEKDAFGSKRIKVTYLTPLPLKCSSEKIKKSDKIKYKNTNTSLATTRHKMYKIALNNI